jgi:hypothetical protein
MARPNWIIRKRVPTEVAVARLALTEQEAGVYHAVGPSVFLRARSCLARGEVIDVRRDPASGRVSCRLAGGLSGAVLASVATDAGGVVTDVDGLCSCSEHPSCGHPVAAVLVTLDGTDLTADRPDVTADRPDPPSPQPTATHPQAVGRRKTGRPPERARATGWEAALSALVDAPAVPPARRGGDLAGIALQFELGAVTAPAGAAPSWRITLRPVVPGRTGWIRGGVSWSSLDYLQYGHHDVDERHLLLLNEILALSTAGQPRYYSSYQQQVHLDGFASRRIWDLLAEAHELGLPLVQAGKSTGPVVATATPVRVSLRADRPDADLVLRPTLLADDTPVAPDCALLVGQPAHGVAWWGVLGQPAPAPRNRVLRLAPLDRPVDHTVAAMLSRPAIVVPALDEARFFERYYPSLLRHVDVVAAGEAVRLPEPGPTVLELAVNRVAGHRLSLEWTWSRSIGDGHHREPLWAPAPGSQATARAGTTRRVYDLLAGALPELLEATPDGPRLAATVAISGDTMIHFLNKVLPRLAGLDDVEVVTDLDGPGPTYQQTDESPVISFVDAGGDGQVDWFDLAVRIMIDGERVPFNELFVALAEEREYLILPSGTYFGLDRAEFQQLRQLIAESRALEDAPPGVVRVGRFQAGLWQELAELGEFTGQAAGWLSSVRSLLDAGSAGAQPLPPGLKAELRPYQREGFGWLAARYTHRLGGVLADDMGLGKTLQALALICHVRDQSEPPQRDRSGSPPPFLVVAPASVVYNWASETDRFAPDLTVRVIAQTRARRGIDLVDAVRGADIVVTSYTLFRLEYEGYAGLAWSGLVLDEAQFVKNPASQGYRCAKRLPVAYKLAITGTPMENNLAELWSLCSITAPGLFPRLDRFTEYYRNPIEKGHDAERLAQLRRRIRPLMLRRRKSDVAADLPAKQEQVIELDLNRRHRKVYQTYLQRERQKVLGLLGDLEKHRFEIFRSLTLPGRPRTSPWSTRSTTRCRPPSWTPGRPGRRPSPGASDAGVQPVHRFRHRTAAAGGSGIGAADRWPPHPCSPVQGVPPRCS